MKPLFIFFLNCLFVISSFADVIASRSTLNTLLGDSGISETFETVWNVETSDVSTDIGPTLNSETVYKGLSGLVVEGVTFYNMNSQRVNEDIQWDKRSTYGLTSGAILGEGGGLRIDFDGGNTTRFGIDVLQFNGYSDTVTVTVYAVNDTTVLYSTSFTAPNAPSSQFFGYSENSGIGSVTFTSSTNAWSPLLDNLTFSVPEPASMVMLAGGCLFFGLIRRASRFYS